MAVALIVAAGRGERLGSTIPKALVSLAGKPMVNWSLETVRSLRAIEEIVLALPPELVARAGSEFPGVVCVAGGTFRSQSVRAALEAASGAGPVLVHDAARPLAPAALFARALEELERSGADAVLAAAPLADTIKEVGGDGRTVSRTLNRAGVWAVQTPQAFARGALARALSEASDELLAAATDDAWLIERRGGTVRVVASEEPNFKVTTAADMRLAELLLADRAASAAT